MGAIIVNAEFLLFLDGVQKVKTKIPILIDADVDAAEGELSGLFDEAVPESLMLDR